MSVQSADTRLDFHLPSLSYIDTRWEEPNLRNPATAPQVVRRNRLATWLAHKVSALLAWRRDSVAAIALSTMSDRELMDIGISRSDLPRVFDPAFNQDLRQRATNV